jgi:hypothetical protein
MRDNDVAACVGRGVHTVDGVLYDPALDCVIIKAGGERVGDVIDDMITLITELDRGLQAHDVGHTVWYEDWRTRVEQAIGLQAGELNTSKA